MPIFNLKHFRNLHQLYPACFVRIIIMICVKTLKSQPVGLNTYLD